MRESDLTERLDERDLLGVTHGPGVYSLEVDVPDSAAAVQERWLAQHDHDAPDDAYERLAAADQVAYVGASNDIYARLCEHVGGDVRRAAFLTVFDTVGVIDVWPDADPFSSEFNRAVRLTRDGWAVWTDGKLLG
jgi:hypothetical protein